MTGCSEKEEKFEEKSAEDLYTLAIERFDGKDFAKSAPAFDEVERQHPYSDWSLRAQLMAGYNYYLAKKYEDAIERFRTFCTLHPGHPHVAYAYYMIGLCNYEQIPLVERDQVPAQEAKEAFNEVLSRFPGSPYAGDAKYKIGLLDDHLAAKEMDVGRYYQDKEKAPYAAVNRYRTVAEHYQRTVQVQEALYRLVECYLSLGLRDQAQASAAVLGHNYPGGKWYQKAYALLGGGGAAPAKSPCPAPAKAADRRAATPAAAGKAGK